MTTTLRRRLIKLVALNKLKEYQFTDNDVDKIYHFCNHGDVMLKLVILRVCGFCETFDIITESEKFGQDKFE